MPFDINDTPIVSIGSSTIEMYVMIDSNLHHIHLIRDTTKRNHTEWYQIIYPRTAKGNTQVSICSQDEAADLESLIKQQTKWYS